MTLAAAGGDTTWLLVELGGGLLVLGLLARLADRFDMSPIPLYLIAGLLLSQLSTGPLAFSDEVIEAGAEIGLVLLLFMLGLEYSAQELVSNLRASTRPGALDLVLNLAPGLAAGLLLGWSLEACILLGGVTYISSSGVIAKVLDELGRMGNRETPAVLSLLVIEDLVMAVYLPVVAVLLADSSALSGTGLVVLSWLAALAILRFAVRRSEGLARLVSSRSDEVLLLTILGFALAAAGLAEGLRLSAAVGAFLAGIVVSGALANRVRELLAPLRDLFAAVFFIFFGLSVDLPASSLVIVVAVALVAVTTVTKIVSGWYAAAQIGAGPRGRLRAGTALVARGEFSIVIAGLGVSAGVESDLGPLAAVYVLLTALAGPVLTRWWQLVARFTPARAASSAP